MLRDPMVLKELEKIIDAASPVTINKDRLVKLFNMVVQSWLNGEEKTSDFISAVKELTKLVPDFVDRKEVNSYQHLPEDDLDKLIREKTQRFSVN